MKLSRTEAQACAKAMTARNYDYASDILVRMFEQMTRSEAEAVLKHVGRYAEKRGPEWPEIPWPVPK